MAQKDEGPASSLALEECSLSERGRELVEGLVDAYVAVVIPEGEYETREQVRERAAEHGFELIPEGANRDVFVVPQRLLTGERTCVVKIPRWLPGAYENAQQVGTGTRSPTAFAGTSRPSSTTGSGGWSCRTRVATSPDANSGSSGRTSARRATRSTTSTRRRTTGGSTASPS